MLLTDIFDYGPQAHLKNEPYAWSWAAAMFLDNHPLSQKAFRKLKDSGGDHSPDFSRRFLKELEVDWPAISEDWQLFVVNADYGYDVARAAITRKAEVMAMPAAGATLTISADRGWQSTGFAHCRAMVWTGPAASSTARNVRSVMAKRLRTRGARLTGSPAPRQVYLRLTEEQGEEHDAFCEGRAQDRLNEDLRRCAGIAPDRFRSLHANQTYANSRSKRAEAALDAIAEGSL